MAKKVGGIARLKIGSKIFFWKIREEKSIKHQPSEDREQNPKIKKN